MSEFEVATVFTEISGATLERAADQLARQKLMVDCVIRLKRAAIKQKGTFIKTIGNNKQMWRFSEAADAMIAAEAMQAVIAEHDAELQLKAGFHFGPVLKGEGVDVYGDSVNVSARIADMAKPGQILTTRPTANLVGYDHGHDFRCIDQVRPKGKTEVIDVMEAFKDEADMTVMGKTQTIFRKAMSSNLELSFAGKKVTMTPESGPVSIGRDNKNDIVVPDTGGMVSRSGHAKIEFIGRRYLLIDESTNGTHVYPNGSEKVFLRRDRLQLDGAGMISPGYDQAEAEAEPIRYVVVPSEG